MFNRQNINVRPLSEELEGIGLDPDKVMGDIERNSGLLESHAGSPPASDAVRPLYEEVEAADGDFEDNFDDDDGEEGIIEWDGTDLDEDEELEFLGEKIVRRRKGYRLDKSTGKMVKVKTSEKRKERARRMKTRGKTRAASRMYYKRKKSKIKRRRKRLEKSGKQKKGFIVRQEGVAAQLSQLREELEQADVNTGEVSPYEEAALNAGWLAMLLGECFEAMGDVEAGEMLYAMSDSAADLSESIEDAAGDLDEDLETKLTSLLEGVAKALATHEEIGSPSLFESIEMGAQNGLYEDDEDDDFDEDDYIDEDDDSDFDDEEIDVDDFDFDDDEGLSEGKGGSGQIKKLARELARDAMKQGLKASHLSPGWDMEQADIEYIEDELGRSLSRSEMKLVKQEFAKAVRG